MVLIRRRSKKRSDANTASRPDRLVFFTDASLGRRIIPDALKASGEEVAVHDKLFSPGMLDRVRLHSAAEKNRIVLMADPEIQHHASATAQLLNAGVRAFVLVDGGLSGTQMARAFVKALPRMKTLCQARAGAFVAHVRRTGAVRIVNAE